MSDIMKCKQALRESAKRSLKKGYRGDWADTMFKVHTLTLLEKIMKKTKKEPSAYNLFISKEMSNGSKFKEAVEKWNKTKA